MSQCSYPPYSSFHHRRLAVYDWMLRTSPADNLTILADIQPAELRRRGAMLSLARRAMDLGHLLHSRLTCPSSSNAPHIETPICIRRTTTHNFILQQQNTCVTLRGSPMECGEDEQPYKTPYFHPRHPHPHRRSDPPKNSLGPA